MRYIPNTDEDCRKMLETIGIESVDDLFTDIPEEVKLKRTLNIPESLGEPDLFAYMKRLSEENANLETYTSFLGAGAYNHFRPGLIDHLRSRGEFSTAYTPYQPEVSQGTLQAIYEFQTLICQLTGMDIANASMYEGASALAEALLMARRITQRDDVILSRAIHPEYRQVSQTYLGKLDGEIKEIPFSSRGTTDLSIIEELLSEKTAAVAIQNPNFFGCVEELGQLSETIHARGALLILVVVEPISLGILIPPGSYGADIVVGEGQSFGNPISYGGPYVGLMATRQKFLRNMPGRLVGETTDTENRRGYVLTLSTREQHIRREKATSNICTNESLCALTAAIYLSVMGKRGLREVAISNLQKAHYAREQIRQLDRYSLPFSAPTFNEFVVNTPRPVREINQRLLEEKMIGGLDLSKFYPDLGAAMLLCVTENTTRQEIDTLCEILAKC
ncbi:MAG: aminomethyl-transferring glycine dehydrogenase subunit GcvPA [Candidatus Tectomicrobia bacterium]|nr:aminomethyl-transferring glycine dehydrogenase subunit GcvPA [Candidatus Tectomicrobia bacterium]